MRQLLEQVLDENFKGGQGSLEFSCSEVALILEPGVLYEDTFAIYANGEGETEGYILSTDPRMECLTERFQGAEDYVAYRFHGEKLESGEEVSGEFHIVSNRGEYRLPFTVLMAREALGSSVGEIRNLLQFAGLARKNWSEALKIFYSGAFAELIAELAAQNENAGLWELYRGLSARAGNSHNLEEFLLAAGLKSSTEYLLRENRLYVENPVGTAEETLTVVRNGWGHTRLKIEVEGDFLYLGKNVLTEEDFLGNRCRLPVYIDGGRLHHGSNVGKVRFIGNGQRLEAEILVRMGEAGSVLEAGNAGSLGGARRERKEILVRLLELYQSYRLQKLSAYSWQRESGALVERLVSLDEKDVMARLLQAQLLITRERFQEGNWILEHTLELLERRELPEGEYAGLYAYYLYLTTLLRPEALHLRQVAEEVEELYRRNSDSWQTAWVLLFLSPEYNRNPSARWELLETQFAQKHTSPLLYLEAVLLLNENPSLLRTLQTYELQVLWYGCKKGALSPSLVEQMLYLAGRKKEFSQILLWILMDCYQKKNSVDALREICSQLIKGGLTGPEYLKWYELGLEQELRLTKLYEYYMMSIDLESGKELSKKALLYFSYQTNLDYERTAFLYLYVVRHREENQELFETYRERILSFVLDQIRKEHINRDLACLYRELLTQEMVDERLARALSRLLFAWSFKIEDARISRVLVCHPGLERLDEYPVTSGCVWVPLYRKGETVFLEDTEGNRYLVGEGSRYGLVRLMEPGELLGPVCYYGLNREEGANLAFAGYVWTHEAQMESYHEEWLYCGRLLADSEEVSFSFHQEVLLRLLEEYRERQGDFTFRDYLEKVDPARLDHQGRKTVLSYLVEEGLQEQAYRWIEDYGPSLAEPDVLLSLLTARIKNVDFWDDSGLLQSAVHAFRKGKYNSSTLRYLALHYIGLSAEMAEVWKAARSYDVDISRLSELLLMQVLFSGSQVPESAEVFRQYVSHSPNSNVEKAFLRNQAYMAFVGGPALESVSLREIARLYACGEKVERSLKLAYVCFYAGGKEENGEYGIMTDFLRELLEEGICLEAFRRLPVPPQLLEPMQDKTVIEYREDTSDKIWIRYTISGAEGKSPERREEMRFVCRGLFIKDFTLFYGERLNYVMERETKGLEERVSEGELFKEETPSDAPACRYELINDILMARDLEDYETMDRLLEQYYHVEYLAERLFEKR